MIFAISGGGNPSAAILWRMLFSTPPPDRIFRKPKTMGYILKFREPGKRPNTQRWARRPVESTRDAIAWMNENKDKAFGPAFVETKSWRPETVAILG